MCHLNKQTGFVLAHKLKKWLSIGTLLHKQDAKFGDSLLQEKDMVFFHPSLCSVFIYAWASFQNDPLCNLLACQSEQIDSDHKACN